MEHRNELKLVLKYDALNSFYSWLYQKTKLYKKYPNRIVNSLYLDDTNFNSAKDNLIGISKRKKFRLRWYNEISESKKIFFEIKKKINRLSQKEVYPILLNVNQLHKICIKDLLDKSYDHLKEQQILQLKKLQPSLFCKYDREYFESIDGLRITVDKNILFSEVPKYLTLINNFKYKFEKTVIEFKFPEALREDVYKLLKPTYFRPTRNSKYLLGLQKLSRVCYI